MLSPSEPSDRSEPHATFVAIADYALARVIENEAAYDAAVLHLLDALAAAFRSLKVPDCAKLLGPVAPGASAPGGGRVPGTSYEFDPVRAAFNNGALMCPLDGDEPRAIHPAESLGALLAVADFVARRDALEGKKRLKVRHVLEGLIKAHALRSALACAAEADGAFAQVRSRVASAAMASVLLGAEREQVLAAAAHAWLEARSGADSAHYSTASSRWRTGDAASRATRVALLASNNELAYPFTYSSSDEPESLSPQGSLWLAKPIECDDIMLAAPCMDAESGVMKRFDDAVAAHFSAKQSESIKRMAADRATLQSLPLAEFVARLVKN